MAGKPIATIGSNHVCPMCTGTVPHVGGPISGPGAPNVLANNKPIALMGDMCVCVGPPDVVAQGHPMVKVNNVPVVCVGDMTAHGGNVVVGEPNITISTAVPTPSTTMPREKIPFPTITTKDRSIASLRGISLEEAEANQDKLRGQAEETPIEENSEEVTLVTNYAREQLHLLALKGGLENFLTRLIDIFGSDIPVDTFEKLYKDAKDNAGILEPTLLIKKKIPRGGKAAFYNNREVQEIWVGETIIRKAVEDNRSCGELLVVLVEEYGHFIDYLLRNHYADTEQKDSLRDEGAYFSYRLLEFNSIENADQYFADATIDGKSYILTWDYSPFHQGLKDFVSEERWYIDDNFGPFEFYKAGFSEKEGEFAHGNIERDGLISAMRETNLNVELGHYEDEQKMSSYLLNIYFGNWKRDYSQGLDPMVIRFFANLLNAIANTNETNNSIAGIVSRLDMGKLKTATIPYNKEITFEFDFWGKELVSATFSPVQTSVKIVCAMLEMMAAKEFVHTPMEDQGIDSNINYIQYIKKLNTDFSPVDKANMGVYVPAEHIDNPFGLGTPIEYSENGQKKKKPNDDKKVLPEFIGVDANNPAFHVINSQFGMKNYIRSATSGKDKIRPKMGRYLNSHTYILHKLEDACKKGGYNKQSCKDSLGAALHTLEDFFAHSNYAEIALIKEGRHRVFPWITTGVNNFDYLRYISDEAYKKVIDGDYNKKSDVVSKTLDINKFNQLASKIPLVTGTFAELDTLASLLPIVAHAFDAEERASKKQTEKQNDRAKRTQNGTGYFKDNINARGYNEVLILQLLRAITNPDPKGTDGTVEDSEIVKLLLKAFAKRDAMYKSLQDTSDNAHEVFEELPENLKDWLRKVRDWSREGRDSLEDSIDKMIDKIVAPIYNLLYGFISLVASNINDLQTAQSSEIVEYYKEARNKTWKLKIGHNPSHTQVAKDDPHHPMHALSAELAIKAVEKVGTVVFECWLGKKSFNDVKAVVDGIMKHPAQTIWQTELVRKWSGDSKNFEDICRASSPSAVINGLLHTNEEIEEVLEILEKVAKQPAFRSLEHFFKKLYEDKKSENPEPFLTLEEKIAQIKKKLKEHDRKLTDLRNQWEEQFPKPDYCDPCNQNRHYVVKENDNLSTIAQKNKTTVEAILELNPNIDPDTKIIHPDTTILLP